MRISEAEVLEIKKNLMEELNQRPIDVLSSAIISDRKINLSFIAEDEMVSEPFWNSISKKIKIISIS